MLWKSGARVYQIFLAVIGCFKTQHAGALSRLLLKVLLHAEDCTESSVVFSRLHQTYGIDHRLTPEYIRETSHEFTERG